MTETLYFDLPADADAHCHWVILDPQGRLAGPVGQGDVAALAAAASGRKGVWVLPASRVLQTEAELPARSAAKALAVAPFALEEQLAADVETLHFAVTGTALPGRWRVAVLDRSSLQAGLDLLAAAGMALHAVVSAAEGVPSIEGHRVALLDGVDLLLRDPGEPARLAIDPVQALADGTHESSVAGLHLSLYATEKDRARWADGLQPLEAAYASCRTHLLPAGVLPFLAQHLHAGSPLNLLQGTFRPRTGWQERLRPWRWAAVLLAALAVVGVLGEVQHLRHLRAEERRLDEQIAADWARIAPGELVPKDLRGRLLQRAELLGQQQAARRGLLPVLSAVASGLAGGGTLKGLSYREGQLEMSVSVADAAALDRLGTQLGQSGYTVDILSDSQEKERYLARMRVQGEGP